LKLKALLVCDGLSYMRTWFPNRPFSWWCLSCLSSTQPNADRTCVRSFLLQTGRLFTLRLCHGSSG